MPFLFVCWSSGAAPCLGHTFRNTVFLTRAENIKVSSNPSSGAKHTLFSPLNYRHLHITLAPVFCCFLPLLNPLKLLHTCSHSSSKHLCCISHCQGHYNVRKKRSWLGCLGEQHQPLSLFCTAAPRRQAISSVTHWDRFLDLSTCLIIFWAGGLNWAKN